MMGTKPIYTIRFQKVLFITLFKRLRKIVRNMLQVNITMSQKYYFGVA